MDAVTYLACKREESALLFQTGQRKISIQYLNDAYDFSCTLVNDAKKSPTEAKEIVIRAMEKISEQAASIGIASLASKFDSLSKKLFTQ
jgi:hypothetical protein